MFVCFFSTSFLQWDGWLAMHHVSKALFILARLYCGGVDGRPCL